MRRVRAVLAPVAVCCLACSSAPAADVPETNVMPATSTPMTTPAKPMAGASGGAPMTSSTGDAGSRSPQTAAVAGVSGGAAGSSGAQAGNMTAVTSGTGGAAADATAAGAGAPVEPTAGTGTPSAGASAAGAGGAGAGTPSAGAGGAAGASAAGAGGAAGETSFQRACVAAGSEVVSIGDSYSNYDAAHTPIATLMTRRAREAGALGPRDAYLDYAELGTTLAAPPAAIPQQWERAKTQLPIKVVIMSAGGNDSLINNPECQRENSDEDPNCQQVVANSLAAAKALWDSMKTAGVGDVLWFWYPYLNGPGILNAQGTGNKLNDYAFKMLSSAAEAASTDSFHAWMIPTYDIFEGHPEYFYVGDGLHANDLGENAIADRLWEVMTENCIGQAEASGCCTP